MSTTANDKIVKNERIAGRHIKHSPNVRIESAVERETTFLVKSSTPFVSAVKKIQRSLDKFDKSMISSNSRSRGKTKYQNGEYKKVNYIVVKGMGKTIEKALSLALYFDEELHYQVDIITSTVKVLDEFREQVPEEAKQEFDDGDEFNDSVYRKRSVSSIEVRIWVKR
ncbi:Rpp20 subunit of nuclear RNase MRP and P-domain-containing protein [Scheffersomyces amazonensis]|uniref:Rpp20 subunit of nuclear RNase MRP and P-domain-containing protein n=1 Tax=Scheffersomyces amazonensis TaxID=1078765 RepID=UPI00315D51F9